MIQECLKQDGLKLADIRPIVKIDVNKTRKLYDYFLQKELIYQNNFQEESSSEGFRDDGYTPESL